MLICGGIGASNCTDIRHFLNFTGWLRRSRRRFFLLGVNFFIRRALVLDDGVARFILFN